MHSLAQALPLSHEEQQIQVAGRVAFSGQGDGGFGAELCAVIDDMRQQLLQDVGLCHAFGRFVFNRLGELLVAE